MLSNSSSFTWVRSGGTFLRGLLALALAAGGLAGCSSGEQIEPFVPDRVVVFGDEQSAITADKRQYTVNQLTDGAVDCSKTTTWVLRLASDVNRPFVACPGSRNDAVSLNYATADAKTAGLAAQVDAHLAADRFNDKDLVTMFVGMHDILEAYAAVDADGEEAAANRLRERGKALGAQVNRVANTGAQVLVVTVPSLGLTPFGRAQNAARDGRADLLARLTSAFNIAMRLEIINDGRMIGLVDAFDLFGAMTRFPQNYGLTNVTQGACLAASPTPSCTTSTLIQDNGTTVTPSRYLWADGLHYGPTGHIWIGTIASARARNNPFS